MLSVILVSWVHCSLVHSNNKVNLHHISHQKSFSCDGNIVKYNVTLNDAVHGVNCIHQILKLHESIIPKEQHHVNIKNNADTFIIHQNVTSTAAASHPSHRSQLQKHNEYVRNLGWVVSRQNGSGRTSFWRQNWSGPECIRSYCKLA